MNACTKGIGAGEQQDRPHRGHGEAQNQRHLDGGTHPSNISRGEERFHLSEAEWDTGIMNGGKDCLLCKLRKE